MEEQYKCEKVRYKDKQAAKQAMKAMKAAGKASRMKSYKCSTCDGSAWHITGIYGAGYTIIARRGADA